MNCSMEDLTCRFYEQHVPKVGDAVMCRIRNVTELGTYVDLLEYDNSEGLILPNEVSRRRIRSMTKVVRPGSVECLCVIRVDQGKGYIDLSKRRISPDEREICEKNFGKAKCVYNILRTVAALMQLETKAQFDELYDKTAWHFDRKYESRGAAYNAFKEAATDPSIFDDCELDDTTKQIVLDVIVKKLKPIITKVKADIAVTCYGVDGVDGVRGALAKGLEHSKPTDDIHVKISLICCPIFEVSVVCSEELEAVDTIHKVLGKIEESITRDHGGTFEVKSPPSVISNAFNAGEDDTEEPLPVPKRSPHVVHEISKQITDDHTTGKGCSSDSNGVSMASDDFLKRS